MGWRKSGGGSVQEITVYDSVNGDTSAKEFNGYASVLNGVATFDISAAGFSDIHSVQVTPEGNFGLSESVPLASVKQVAPDLTSVSVNVIRGINPLELDKAAVEFVPDGTKAWIRVIGV